MDNILGKGTFSEVTESDGYAIKTINNNYLLTGVREAIFLSECYHPNIVKMIRVQAADSIKIVMEKWDISLFNYLEKNPLLEIDIVYNMMLDLLHAIDYIHSLGIIHTDIKLGNILINTTTMKVALCDFGMSVMDILPEKLSVVQTKIFRAPEVNISTRGIYSFPIDMWSFGCVLYKLCSGTNLFRDTIDDDVTIDLSHMYMMDRSTRTSRMTVLQTITKNEVTSTMGWKVAHHVGAFRLNSLIKSGIFDIMVESLIPNTQTRLTASTALVRLGEKISQPSQMQFRLENEAANIFYPESNMIVYGKKCIQLANQICTVLSQTMGLEELEKEVALVIALSICPGVYKPEHDYALNDKDHKLLLVRRISEILEMFTTNEKEKK